MEILTKLVPFSFVIEIFCYNFANCKSVPFNYKNKNNITNKYQDKSTHLGVLNVQLRCIIS